MPCRDLVPLMLVLCLLSCGAEPISPPPADTSEVDAGTPQASEEPHDASAGTAFDIDITPETTETADILEDTSNEVAPESDSATEPTPDVVMADVEVPQDTSSAPTADTAADSAVVLSIQW